MRTRMKPGVAVVIVLLVMFAGAIGHGLTALILLGLLYLTTGQVHLLDAMPCDPTMGLSELIARLAPVIEVLSAASLGARTGDAMGAVASLPEQWEGSVLHGASSGVRRAGELSGDVLQIRTQIGGEIQRQTEHLGIAVAAHARMAGAEIGAQIDQGLGRARQFGASLDAAALRGMGHVAPHEAPPWLHAQAATCNASLPW